MLRSLVLATCLLLSLGAGAASAQEVFSANFEPSRPEIVTQGTGTASFVLNSQGDEVLYEISVQNLTSPEIAAHVHRADGSIVFQLPLGPSKNGVWAIGLLDAFALRAGTLYVLVHTQNNPGGEIRGNLKSGTVAAARSSWGAVKSLYETGSR